ncbi:MAG: adenosylcobinamide-GDP ribazoletransferase [Pseudomonadota bacterium]
MLAADTAACVRFFSRLPLPKVNSVDNPAAAPHFPQIARAAPLAGLVVALPAACLGTLLGYTALPAFAVAALMLAALCATTGALHEDGLSDVADGFFGGSTPARRLEIMKDSRIGAFGALALVLTVVLRLSLLAVLWQEFSPADAALLFLSTEVVSRAILVWQWSQHPLARPEGLAARFGRPDAATARNAALLTLPFLLPAALLLSPTALFLALAVAIAAGFAIGHICRSKIGGVTGDVLGAVQQICGLGFLLGMLMVP